jgi:hypothetical protein
MAGRRNLGWATKCAVAALVGVSAVACSSSGSNAGGDAGDPTSNPDGEVICVWQNLHPDPYVTGLKKVGTLSGAFTFVLVKADPVPPAEPATNTWTIQVLDQSGKPVTDAMVTLPKDMASIGYAFPKNPWMPAMHHGNTLLQMQPTSNGDGTFTAQLYFSMAGLWQVFFEAQSGTTTDAVSFYFCPR